MEALCKIRDLSRAIAEFENSFQREFTISLNEGMTLCTLKKGTKCLTSGLLAKELGLSYSNMSKVIKQLEDKELIARCIGKEDKRQMLFSITEKGKALLDKIKRNKITLPEYIKVLLQ